MVGYCNAFYKEKLFRLNLSTKHFVNEKKNVSNTSDIFCITTNICL